MRLLSPALLALPLILFSSLSPCPEVSASGPLRKVPVIWLLGQSHANGSTLGYWLANPLVPTNDFSMERDKLVAAILKNAKQSPWTKIESLSGELRFHKRDDRWGPTELRVIVGVASQLVRIGWISATGCPDELWFSDCSVSDWADERFWPRMHAR